MGADKPNSADYEPLLPTQAPAVQEENASGQPTDGVRKWEGGLLQCCGACDLTGWGSCLLGYYVPCVVYGQNAKRALRQSAWLHGLLYLSFFCLSMWLAMAVLGAANHNVLATCNGPPPPHPPHHPPHPLPGDGPDGLMPRPEAEPLVGPLGRGLWDKLFGPDDDGHHHHHDMWHHEHDDDDDEDDDHDKHHHKHEADGNDGDHEHEGKAKKGKKCKKDKKGSKGPELPLDPETADAAADAFRELGTFDIRKAGPHPEGPEGRHPHPPPHHGRPECQKAVGLWVVAMMLVIATPLLAVRYAAKRRTMLRKQFGIAGSKLGDFCTWFWCGPCALCQETRTLWVNNVHEGYWHGPTKLGAAPTVPSSAPAPQFMTTGAQTCQT